VDNLVVIQKQGGNKMSALFKLILSELEGSGCDTEIVTDKVLDEITGALARNDEAKEIFDLAVLERELTLT
jgi:hypothetical protein